MSNLFIGILAVVALFSFMALGESELEVMQMEASQHCEMVDLWESTGGDFGWPDYNKSYARSCK